MGADNTFGETNFNPEKVKPRFVIMWGVDQIPVIFYKDFTFGFWGKNNKPLDSSVLDTSILKTYKTVYKKRNAKYI